MKYLLACVFLSIASSASAAIIEFIPPNDTTGFVHNTNHNNAWDDGRGIVFQMTSDETINSIGLFHDLTDIVLAYELAQVTSVSGNVTSGQTILASGYIDSISTTGLEWIDIGIPDLLLTSGNSYHLEFRFLGLGNQNFFYDNDNVTFSQGSFSLIDGTQDGNTPNFVMAAFRLNTVSAVPVPAAIWLFGIGLIGLVGMERKHRTQA